MKFKNYRNPYTNDNRIYSYRDLYDMPFGELIKRKQEVLSQYRVLGVPTEKELQGSDNVVHVEAYTREDGTEVKAHYRSKPNSGRGVNNDMGLPTGGASEVTDVKEKKENSSDVETENILNKQSNETIEQTEQTPEQKEQEKDKRLYPDEVAGVKRGEPKTFEQMIQQGVNPKYMSEEDEDGEYSNNCACCTLAAELVIRGYDVEAGPADNAIAKELSGVNKSAYLDPKTGEECIPEKIDIDDVDCFNYLDENVKQGERYEFSYYTQRNLFYGESSEGAYNNQKTQGHIVLITRNEKNDLVLYDPQDGDRHEGKLDVKNFLESWVNERTLFDPRVLRVDNKVFNPKYINAVVRKRNSM